VRAALERLAPIIDELGRLIEVVPELATDFEEVRSIVRTGSTWADVVRARELSFLLAARVGATTGPMN
jgi:hypothetical protein